MAIELFELCGRDPEIRFSPFVLRARMALAHKGLDHTPIPWRFIEKDAIAFADSKTVPVLRDGDTVVADSWNIALYLEQTYPDRPSLFAGEAGFPGVVFVKNWVGSLFPLAGPLAMLPVWKLLDEENKQYFRKTREERVGRTLEELYGDEEKRLDTFRKGLTPLRTMLAEQPFIGGEHPNHADHLVFSTLQWIRIVNPVALLESDDPVNTWFESMLDAYGGIGRAMKTCRD